MMRPCAVVPSFNHAEAIGGVVAALRQAGLPVYIIDDGSAPPAAASIGALHCPDQRVIVEVLPVNRGKGAAVMHGMRLAWRDGYTHAVQVDADGQHDLAVLPTLLAQSRLYPDALISGQPTFDSSMPLGRRIGRWITHVWVWIETLSMRITDSMCGFRVYPLAPVMRLLATTRIGTRMDFDTDIMVRLFRAGTDVRMVPVRVVYPPNNTSNFRLWRDNLAITAMHTRLVFSLLASPVSARRWSAHWSGLAERGGYWGLLVAMTSCRLLGRRACLAILAPAVLWFLLTGRTQRQASRVFLTRATGRQATLWQVYRHFMSFAARAVDSVRGWDGAIPRAAVVTENPRALKELAARPGGALLVVSHLGDPDLARAVLDDATRARLTILVHTIHAVNYSRLLRAVRPAAALNLVEVTDINPATAIALQQRVERGEWVVIAGDRTPVSGAAHVACVKFLGHEAAFSLGPWVLASLLRCPVHLLFCLRSGQTWRLTLEPFADAIVLDRSTRRTQLAAHAAAYAGRLETYARAYPMQWYNFFDFWARPGG